MIFAKLDVCFWRHKKFKRAGPSACGYYAAALAYLREDETRDGILEDDVIGQLLDVGEREARKFLQRLVEVGLFERVDGGYLLLGYAEKNETRDAIEARRAATRERVDSFRRKRRGNGGRNVHDEEQCNALHPSAPETDVTPSVTEISSHTERGAVPGSGSDSLSDSGSDLRGGAGETEPRAPSGAGLCAVYPDTPLSPELREAASMLSVQDVDGTWLKFCGHYAGQTLNVAGKWQHWCVNEAKIERRERDRKNTVRYQPPGAPEPPNPYDGANVRADRAKREREMRQAERDASPPPIADLMAAIGGNK